MVWLIYQVGLLTHMVTSFRRFFAVDPPIGCWRGSILVEQKRKKKNARGSFKFLFLKLASGSRRVTVWQLIIIPRANAVHISSNSSWAYWAGPSGLKVQAVSSINQWVSPAPTLIAQRNPVGKQNRELFDSVHASIPTDDLPISAPNNASAANQDSDRWI